MIEKIIPTPKDWWGNPENAQIWLDQDKGYEDANVNFRSESVILSEIREFKKNNKIETILEVGAGSGRLIGAISNQFPDIKCYSIDINPVLSNYVKEKFSKVDVSVGEIISLPFESNLFDLVFTYQVLQHVPPEEIYQALGQLVRVSRKEIWLCEGYNPEFINGAMRHNAHNGAFAWKFNRMIKCYEMKIPEYDDISLNGQRLYKIRK